MLILKLNFLRKISKFPGGIDYQLWTSKGGLSSGQNWMDLDFSAHVINK